MSEQVLDRNLAKNTKITRKAKNSWKFVLIVAKQRRSPFKLTRLLTKKFQKFNFAIFVQNLLGHPVHSGWKSQKKSHSTLRAKRATFSFWVDKSSLKMPKMVHFGEFLKSWRLRSNSVTRQVTFKLVENAKIRNFKCDIFGWFSNTVSCRKPE